MPGSRFGNLDYEKVMILNYGFQIRSFVGDDY